jgi:hypothetical protein
VRYHRQVKKKRIVPWAVGVEVREEVAVAVTYVGSAEHKNHPSPAGPPRLRMNDASPCDPRYTSFEAPTQALRDAVRAARTSDFVGRFPKYAWGVLDGRMYEARLVNAELGTYKAYPLESEQELPEDPDGVVEAINPWRH